MTLIQPHPSQLPLEGGERREPQPGEKAKGGDSGGRERERHARTGRRRKERKGGRKEAKDGTPGPLSSFRHPKLLSNRISPHLTCSLSPPPSYLPTFLLACHFPFRLSNLTPHLQLGGFGFCASHRGRASHEASSSSSCGQISRFRVGLSCVDLAFPTFLTPGVVGFVLLQRGEDSSS